MAVKLALLVAASLALSASATNARNLRRNRSPEDDDLPSAADVASLSAEALHAVEAEQVGDKKVVVDEEKKRLKAATPTQKEKPAAVKKVVAAKVEPEPQEVQLEKNLKEQMAEMDKQVAKGEDVMKATAVAKPETIRATPGIKVEAETVEVVKHWEKAAKQVVNEEQANEDAANALESALQDEEKAEKAALADEDTMGSLAAALPGQDELVFGDKTAATLEKDVTKLVLGLGKSATASKTGKLDPAMAATIETIKDMIERDMIPKVMRAHLTSQKELKDMAEATEKCAHTKDTQIELGVRNKQVYEEHSPLHKTCRNSEAQMLTEAHSCIEEMKDKEAIKNLKCREFAMVEKKYSDQEANRQIVKKGGSEAPETYVRRLTETFCSGGVEDGQGGCGCGFQCKFLKSKHSCMEATQNYIQLTEQCESVQKDYESKKKQCDNLQDSMDFASCQYAIDVKDACEEYAECHNSKADSFRTTQEVVMKEEQDRKSEWRGLMRISCLINSFVDCKVNDAEITACKEKEHDTSHLTIEYPTISDMEICKVPDKYPTTAEYREKEFGDLPMIAKGKQDENECMGVLEINTKPADGSPDTCICNRVTMNGPYSPGPLVKCVNCLKVKMTTEKNSCPDGTKLFSPRNRNDWRTLLVSTGPLPDPHWIVDVTHDGEGCGGCTSHAMNSGVKEQKMWKTSDGSPWWLRSDPYDRPDGDYMANCYLNLLHTPWESADVIEFDDDDCDYHSKSYYCQPKMISETPKKGSPDGCVCKKVEVTGKFAPGGLLRCVGCLDVYKSTQKNSCPMGTKIFAPTSRQDWRTLMSSVEPLHDPNWIIDITRPQDGCGGCDRHAMNSDSPAQATWRTADGAAWWLRSTFMHNEPSEDYNANCYMGIGELANENTIHFSAEGGCQYHSKSYYCQVSKK